MSSTLTERCLAQLDTPFGQQNPQEFEWMTITYVKGAGSWLEIGSSFGRSLRGFAKVLAPGAIIRSIDLGHDRHSPYNTEQSLLNTIAELCAAGFDAQVIFADSKLQ